MPVPVPVPDTRRVPFDHERLHVYQAALDFSARGSTTAIVSPAAQAEAKQKLERIASKLIKLAKSLEER